MLYFSVTSLSSVECLCVHATHQKTESLKILLVPTAYWQAGVGVWWGEGNHLNLSRPVAGGRHTNNTAEIQATLARAVMQIVINRNKCLLFSYMHISYSYSCREWRWWGGGGFSLAAGNHWRIVVLWFGLKRYHVFMQLSMYIWPWCWAAGGHSGYQPSQRCRHQQARRPHRQPVPH